MTKNYPSIFNYLLKFLSNPKSMPTYPLFLWKMDSVDHLLISTCQSPMAVEEAQVATKRWLVQLFYHLTNFWRDSPIGIEM
jgi:hypothetical protein